MTTVVGRGLCGGVALLALCGSLAAQAQQATPNFGSNGIYREDPASALGRYLRMVTANPRNLEALTGAGNAALKVGDAQAAIGFYARAEAISPRNGRIKAGLGSALVLLNQEQAALRYFDDATKLGVPESDIASDRGLAYDLRGSAKRAQRDYAIALQRGADDETTRRMALSLAISGEKAAALTLLDPLLRRQDTAAWRARAFILAMTGDPAGASRAAEAVMSPTLAAGFVPFFRKLPSLRPGEKAAAVHFGNFPGEGRPMRIDDLFNQAEVAARVALENSPRSSLDAGQVDTGQSALGSSSLGTSSFGRTSSVANAEGQLAAPTTSRAPDVRIAAATPRPNAAAVPVVRPAAPSAEPVRAATSAPAPAFTSVATPTPTPPPAMISTPRVETAPAPTPTPVPAPIASPLVRTGIAAAAVPIPDATAASSSAPILSGVSASASPGFGVAPLSAPRFEPAPLTSETRLADISATVREVAREPLVGSVELPPSTLPAVDQSPETVFPSASGPTPARAGVPDLASARLTDIAEVLAAPSGIATSVAAPPPSRPRVEAARPFSSAPALGAGPKVETFASSVPPAPRSTASGPRVEFALNRPASSSPPASNRAQSAGIAPATSGSSGMDAEESRTWVQIAGGADERAFPSEWRKLRDKAPDLLADRTAWTTPLKATNRLLVGPFENGRDAQDFVNKLGGKGITAFAWTSAQGQAIAKLAAK